VTECVHLSINQETSNSRTSINLCLPNNTRPNKTKPAFPLLERVYRSSLLAVKAIGRNSSPTDLIASPSPFLKIPFLKPESLRRYVGAMDEIASRNFETEWANQGQLIVFPLTKKYVKCISCSFTYFWPM
ncbi:hypothetical protein EUTSA_v10028161mg, partial [Eutrema salsugineum]